MKDKILKITTKNGLTAGIYKAEDLYYVFNYEGDPNLIYGRILNLKNYKRTEGFPSRHYANNYFNKLIERI
jgi:hypothetical protein